MESIVRGMYIRTSGLLLERHDRAAAPVSTVRDVLDLCTQNSGRNFPLYRTIIFIQLGMQTNNPKFAPSENYGGDQSVCGYVVCDMGYTFCGIDISRVSK